MYKKCVCLPITSKLSRLNSRLKFPLLAPFTGLSNMEFLPHVFFPKTLSQPHKWWAHYPFEFMNNFHLPNKYRIPILKLTRYALHCSTGKVCNFNWLTALSSLNNLEKLKLLYTYAACNKMNKIINNNKDTVHIRSFGQEMIP